MRGNFLTAVCTGFAKVESWANRLSGSVDPSRPAQGPQARLLLPRPEVALRPVNIGASGHGQCLVIASVASSRDFCLHCA
jgi:hypothetical protein